MKKLTVLLLLFFFSGSFQSIAYSQSRLDSLYNFYNKFKKHKLPLVVDNISLNELRKKPKRDSQISYEEMRFFEIKQLKPFFKAQYPDSFRFYAIAQIDLPEDIGGLVFGIHDVSLNTIDCYIDLYKAEKKNRGEIIKIGGTSINGYLGFEPSKSSVIYESGLICIFDYFNSGLNIQPDDSYYGYFSSPPSSIVFHSLDSSSVLRISHYIGNQNFENRIIDKYEFNDSFFAASGNYIPLKFANIKINPLKCIRNIVDKTDSGYQSYYVDLINLKTKSILIYLNKLEYSHYEKVWEVNAVEIDSAGNISSPYSIAYIIMLNGEVYNVLTGTIEIFEHSIVIKNKYNTHKIGR